MVAGCRGMNDVMGEYGSPRVTTSRAACLFVCLFVCLFFFGVVFFLPLPLSRTEDFDAKKSGFEDLFFYYFYFYFFFYSPLPPLYFSWVIYVFRKCGLGGFFSVNYVFLLLKGKELRKKHRCNMHGEQGDFFDIGPPYFSVFSFFFFFFNS